jgi:hypothetical protein
MSSAKLFTKSRFKTSLDCPTKLYYASNDKEYANSKLDDPFLKALAKGGFQVGALAQCYYPNGIEVKHKDYDKSLAETSELLKQKNVTIFEAAIKFNNLFVRVDVFEKIGNVINLIEVKSKSADPSTFDEAIWNKPERKKNVYKLHGDWQGYIYDVAFQAYVIKKAFPDCQVNSYLMCADKTKLATVEGLNQRFLLKEAGRNTEVLIVGDVSKAALGTEVLCRLDINEAVSIIHQDLEMSERFDGRGFEKGIEYLAEMFQKNERIKPEVGTKCKACEFRTQDDGKKSGFNECWKICHAMDSEELAKPFVFDVWCGAGKAFDAGKILMEDLDETDFSPNLAPEGLSKGQRQWLQVEKTINNDKSSYIDVAGLGNEFEKFTYPLHMIDFETSMAPIPFNKGRHPYEQIAFQFSHHTIFEDGSVEHSDEFISSTPGEFPNFLFVRALKKALSRDNGTIFRYSPHENSVLCQIRIQLQLSSEPDKDELIEFIESITSKKDGKKVLWDGPRNMVDLLALVKGYYYNPAMKGSNSIKYVLPAILNESEFLQKKYSSIYNSANFTNHIWIKKNEDGSLQDPYKTLEPVLNKYDYEMLEHAMTDANSEINNGGAALTAYAMMQFTQMTDSERNLTRKALLRYCELDTLAMVMIYEFWQDVVKQKGKKKKAKAS